MKYSEAINNFIHHVKRLTTENNNQNFFEVFRIGTERKEILTSQTAELKQT